MEHSLLFSGSSNTVLASDVAKKLGISLGNVDLQRFADGEIRPWIKEDVRGKTVFVLQSFSYDMDDHIMELCLMGDALRRSAPKTMVAVIPYFGYARQDKQHRPGEPVSARVIAKFLEVSKFREVITIDLHNDAIVGFFQVPVTHLSALSVLSKEVKQLKLKDAIVVSPDVGGVKRARNLAYDLDIPMVVMEKRRFLDRHDTTDNYQIIGDVSGKSAVIIDDVISTGSTIAHAAHDLKKAKAQSVTVLATHGVLAGKAKELLEEAPIDHIVITDTIAHNEGTLSDRYHVISTAGLLADAITVIGK